MIYTYIHNITPDLDVLETEINNSFFSSAIDYLRWDGKDSYLKVYTKRDLTEEEKIILDSYVENL
jgi:hypothetical protein